MYSYMSPWVATQCVVSHVESLCMCVCGGRGWGPTGLCLLSTDCCPMLLQVHVDFMFCTHPPWPASSGQQSADFWPFQRCWCLPDCSPRGAGCETLLSQGWVTALVICSLAVGVVVCSFASSWWCHAAACLLTQYAVTCCDSSEWGIIRKGVWACILTSYACWAVSWLSRDLCGCTLMLSHSLWDLPAIIWGSAWTSYMVQVHVPVQYCDNAV